MNDETPVGETNLDLETQFPSIEVAYGLALTSFETALKRLDSIDSKNQNLISFCLASFVLIPTIGNANRISLNSRMFFLSIALLAISAFLSVLAAKRGIVTLISPQKLFDDYLDLPRIEFQKDIIAFIAKSYDEVLDLIDFKWKLNTYSLITYLAALAAAALWVALAPTA